MSAITPNGLLLFDFSDIDNMSFSFILKNDYSYVFVYPVYPWGILN